MDKGDLGEGSAGRGYGYVGKPRRSFFFCSFGGNKKNSRHVLASSSGK